MGVNREDTRKEVQGKTEIYRFEDEMPRRPRPKKRRVGRLKISRSRKTVIVWILEQFQGQVFTSDLKELFNGGLDEIPIFVFENVREKGR